MLACCDLENASAFEDTATSAQAWMRRGIKGG